MTSTWMYAEVLSKEIGWAELVFVLCSCVWENKIATENHHLLFPRLEVDISN